MKFEKNPNLIWKAYRAVLRYGDDLVKVQAELNLTEPEYNECADYPPFAEAVQTAMADRMPACFDDLSEEAKLAWQTLSDPKAVPDAKQAALLAVAEGGKREKQKLVAYGLMQNFFDVRGACNALKIPIKTFRDWLANDPEFADLIAEVQASKKFFVEGQLFKLIALGSEKATMFAAERLMKDEYGKRVEHVGNIDHQHTHTQGLNLALLPVDVRSKIFELLSDSGLIDHDGMLTVEPSLEAEAVKRLE